MFICEKLGFTRRCSISFDELIASGVRSQSDCSICNSKRLSFSKIVTCELNIYYIVYYIVGANKYLYYASKLLKFLYLGNICGDCLIQVQYNEILTLGLYIGWLCSLNRGNRLIKVTLTVYKLQAAYKL